MGTVLASAILSRAATTILDVAATRWPDAEKLIYLNDGQRLVVLYKPDAGAIIDIYRLGPGTRQRIPDGTSVYRNLDGDIMGEGVLLLDLIKNMGIDGETAGGSIDPTDLQVLNAFNSNWHAATPAADVQSYALDERYPSYFFVYPPQPSQLWDKAASVFKSGTYSWGAIGANTIANVSNKLQITYVASALGAAVDLNDAEDLTSDLTVGAEYVLTCKAKYTGGAAGATLSIGELDVVAEVSTALTTSELTYSIPFTATHATNMRFQLAGMGAANIVTIDDIVLSKSPGYVEISYPALPDDVAAVGNTINLSDRFQTALYYYIVHRCYSKDAALSPYNASRAIEYWNLFVTELGRMDMMKKMTSPNTMQPNPSPAIKEAR